MPYIIKGKLTLLLEPKRTTYFENFVRNDRNDVTNVFSSHWTSNKKSALKFYDKSEAEKFLPLLSYSLRLKLKVVKV